MTKKEIVAIAKAFKQNTHWTQYLYATQGFTDGKHNQRGRDLYDQLKRVDAVVFDLGLTLKRFNKKFDYIRFLESCGMQEGSSRRSFVPNSDYIKLVQR